MYYDVSSELLEALNRLELTTQEYTWMMQYLSPYQARKMNRYNDIGERLKYLLKACKRGKIKYMGKPIKENSISMILD